MKNEMVDLADVADIVQRTVRDHMGGAIQDAIRPFVERAPALGDYASALVELERKKGELPGAGDTRTRGCLFARYARVAALGRGDWSRGAFEAKAHWGAEDPVVKAVTKALTSSNPSSAGSIIPPAVSAEFIELRRNRTVMRRISRTVPMPFGQLTMRKLTAGASAFYVGESANVTPSEQTVGDVTWNFKKLVALTPVSNSLLRQSAGEADMMVRDDLLAVSARKEDVEFIYGDGDENTPVGLINRFDSTNNTVAQTGTAADDRFTDFSNMVSRVENANLDVESDPCFFVLSPRLFWSVYKTATIIATDPAAFPFSRGFDMRPPRLLGFEVLKSKVVDQGASDPFGTRHDALFICGPHSVIADGLNVELTVHDGAAYFDGANVVSAVSRDESVIKVVSEHDWNMRHSQAASVMTGVTIP